MNKIAWLSVILAAIVGAVAGADWHQSRAQLRDLRLGELASIAALLREDQKLLQTLQSDFPNSGILSSYLEKIRADGVAKHADMKQRLDELAENDSAIVALINVYSPHAKTAAFAAESEKFRRYAIGWRDRWNSVMELFMAGGNYAVAEFPFPNELLGAVQGEMAAAKW